MKTIIANELKTKLDQDNVILIDVREPAEYRSASIDGACLIPLSQISCDKLPSKKKPIVIHCASGKRSQEACRKLLEQDPTLDLYSLEGGITAWQKSGFSVKRTGRYTLPLDRQTQLTAGLIVFLGVILGTFVHHNFYWLSGFVGLGLMFAGLTGWCGMARLLAKMPWNR